MAASWTAIDCDVHPRVLNMRALHPYLDEYWREQMIDRGIETLESIAYPPNAPISARPDWRNANGEAGLDVVQMRAHALDRWNTGAAICNCLFGIQMIYNEDMANACARAVNDWLAKEWLDHDPRLRGSIVIPLQNVEYAVDEIERCAKDKRFVQILVLCMGELPLGRRQYWPIYAAAERHGLPLGIHAGSSYHHPVTSLGWPTFYLEDYLSQSQGFQSQVASLICEGVFVKYPKLKVVLIESGVTWVPSYLWRLAKFWRGVHFEVPWIDRSPLEIFRENFRLTVQPIDAPDTGDTIERVIDHLQSDDLLLYSSDYPHWQFDGDAVISPAIPDRLRHKIQVDNPLATYSRLREEAP